MKPLTADEVAAAVRGRWLRPPRDPSLSGLSTDTRTARPGDLWFALRGETFDAHDFLPRAAAADCAAAVVARDAPQLTALDDIGAMGLLLVGDPRRALGELAAYYRGLVAATMVAVTGSNGKTTVKRMIEHILSRRLAGRCSPKSFNNDVGVPLTLLSVEPSDAYAVCEVGTNAPGEIAALGRLVRPDVAVVTSVSAAHTEKLGSVERVAVEKASLLSCLAPGGLGVIWADNPALRRAVEVAASDAPVPPRIIGFGLSEAAALRLTDYQPAADGRGCARFQINGRLWADLPLAGRHNALNALAAIAVAQRFGWDQADAAAALSDMPAVTMRLQRVDAGDVVIINDAYNANPASVSAAADVLGELPARRRVLVVGDMLELGDDAVAMHRQTGRDVAARELDLLIGVGPLGRYIAEGARQGGAAIECVEDTDSAVEAVPSLLRAGDVVLVKGSRRMRLERVVDAIRRAFGGADAPSETPMHEEADR